MGRRFADYLGESGGRRDLADQIANSRFEDPVPRIWISPVDVDDLDSEWTASWQFGEDIQEFSGLRDAALAWARGRPAAARWVLVGQEYTELDPSPIDVPAPPAAGPTVRIFGPDHDGRYLALWYHRGEQKQFWGNRAKVTDWAFAQPAERRLVGVDDQGWLPLER